MSVTQCEALRLALLLYYRSVIELASARSGSAAVSGSQLQQADNLDTDHIQASSFASEIATLRTEATQRGLRVCEITEFARECSPMSYCLFSRHCAISCFTQS